MGFLLWGGVQGGVAYDSVWLYGFVGKLHINMVAVGLNHSVTLPLLKRWRISWIGSLVMCQRAVSYAWRFVEVLSKGAKFFFSSTGIGSNNAIKGYIARFHPKWKEWCTCMISLRDFLYIDALFGLISYNDPRWWFQFFFTCSSLIGQDVQFGSYVSRWVVQPPTKCGR